MVTLVSVSFRGAADDEFTREKQRRSRRSILLIKQVEKKKKAIQNLIREKGLLYLIKQLKWFQIKFVAYLLYEKYKY